MLKTQKALNEYLADLNVFYRKTQNYHWNIVGKGFFEIHAKLEEIYDDINEKIDVIAERILSIGGRPYGSMKKYLEITHIEEAKDEDVTSEVALNSLKKDVEHLLNHTRTIKLVSDEENDYGTSAEMDEHIQGYEKLLWMINSYLK